MIRVDELLAAARERTGLTDYGDEWFTEPLKVLVEALNTEARLSELGLALTRRRLAALLADRLRLRAIRKQHPDIDDTDVTVAAEICGLPRTGSTLLHRLLAASPELTSTLSWETSYPLPFPGEGPDAAERKRRARERAKLFLDMSPDFADIHTIEWDGP
ncbi:MAG TPA: sulfotransferase, partial [Nocardioides sp.]|nr:sulfotransferase [Nocardioides sp.]